MEIEHRILTKKAKNSLKDNLLYILEKLAPLLNIYAGHSFKDLTYFGAFNETGVSKEE